MRGTWDRRRSTAVAIGGVAGAALRWAVLTTVEPGSFPWPVLVINIVGSLLLGAVLAEEWVHPSARLVLHDLAGIGFCGGLTTFSTFAVEIVDLTRDGHLGTAVVYGVASVGGALIGIVVGAAALRRGRAVTLPLEEQP